MSRANERKQLSRREKMEAKYNKSLANSETGENINRITFEAGKTTLVHLLDMDYEEGFFHFLKDPDGNNKKVKCVGGLTKAERKISHEECPVCAEWKESDDSDIAPKHRYFYNAIQGELAVRKSDKKKVIRWDKLIRLLDIGPQIFNQIGAIQVDEDYEDVDEIYLKITRKGKGLNTEYQVLASPRPSPLPENLEGDEYKLEDFVEDTPLDDIYKILGDDVPGDEGKAGDNEEEFESFEEPKEKSTRRRDRDRSTSSTRRRREEPEEEKFEDLESFDKELEEVEFDD